MARRRLPSGEPPASPAPLELKLERRDTTLVLRLEGEFDLSGVGQIEATLEQELGSGPRQVVFDLTDVSFLDMAGLMTLIRADERARRESYDIEVIAPKGLARRVFTLTRAGDQLTMVNRLR